MIRSQAVGSARPSSSYLKQFTYGRPPVIGETNFGVRHGDENASS